MSSRLDKRTLRGILLLIPLLAVLAWIVWQATGIKTSQKSAIGNQQSEERTELFPFDPNEASYEDFRRLGIEAKTAAGIVKYRTRGKIFEIPEDFAACYGITDSIYAALKPYITIGTQYRVKARENYSRYTYTNRNGTKAEIDLAPFDPNMMNATEFQKLGFSERQAEVIVNYRRQIGGFKTAEDFAKCYVVSEERFEALKPFINIVTEPAVIHNTDLNTMDSAELVAIRGIGARSAHDIILYRSRLGGYARVEQLADLKIVTERNFEMIVQQIWVDTTKIQKISINFAPPQELGKHPYLTAQTLRKVLQGRQLKGGWNTIEEMINDHTLTSEEAERLCPYIVFN